jgi:hypothetical protein
MTDTAPPDSISIRRRPIVWQIGFFSALLLIEAVVHALSELSNYARLGDPLAPWEPFTWEFSSVLVIGALIPLIAIFKRRFPIDTRSWRLTVPVHLLATVPYSIIHVTGMVALRKLVYVAVGSHYDFGPLHSGWLYEYRKDFVSYWLILAACRTEFCT